MIREMDDINVIATIALLLDDDEIEERKSTRSTWTRTWLKWRKYEGAFNTTFKQLMEEDSDGFKGYVRMDKNHFIQFVDRLRPSLIKEDTNMRECIKPEEMCCLMLRYLASRESFCSLEYH